MGPASVNGVTVKGDAYAPVPFTPAVTPPTVWHPGAIPNPVSQGQSTSITYQIPQACRTRFEIIQDSDTQPGVTLVRTLHDWTERPAGVEAAVWDGTADDGSMAAPGVYLARVQAQYTLTGPTNYSSTILTVAT
jgi:flagellar hook assembly protein FlgD